MKSLIDFALKDKYSKVKELGDKLLDDILRRVVGDSFRIPDSGHVDCPERIRDPLPFGFGLRFGASNSSKAPCKSKG